MAAERKRVSPYKIITTKTTVGDAVSAGYSILQDLRDQMSEWADNMENGNLGHTSKCEEVREAADSLDSCADDEPDVSDCIAPKEVTIGESVNRRKNKGPSRAVQRDNAVANLDAAKSACEERIEELEEEKEKLEAEEAIEGNARVGEIEAEIEACEELRDHLENTIGDAEGVDFPGMY